ncbi:MAG: YdcF family protein [Bacteroidota bacterium]
MIKALVQSIKAHKYIWLFSTLLCIVISLYLFRISIFKSAAGFLIQEDKIPSSSQACYILSGNAFDRGNKAIELYKSNKVMHFYCSGENLSNDLKAFGINKKECALQKEYLVKNQVPDSCISLIEKGTSSYEELKAIDKYCHEHYIDRAIIVSSKFHTRRIQLILDKMEAYTSFTVIGASSSNFKELEWWNSEYGLIALNNEYVKWMYYKLKY